MRKLTGFGGHIDAQMDIVVDHTIVVVPENEQRWLVALDHPAGEPQRRSRLEILIRWSENFCLGLCWTISKETISVINYSTFAFDFNSPTTSSCTNIDVGGCVDT